MSDEHDPVHHPSHYAKAITPIEVIEAWDLGFCLGNTVKYIARCEDKGNPVQDLEKAAWYLNREIERRRRDEANEGAPTLFDVMMTVQDNMKKFSEAVNRAAEKRRS